MLIRALLLGMCLFMLSQTTAECDECAISEISVAPILIWDQVEPSGCESTLATYWGRKCVVGETLENGARCYCKRSTDSGQYCIKNTAGCSDGAGKNCLKGWAGTLD